MILNWKIIKILSKIRKLDLHLQNLDWHHNLAIERGRYENIDRSERICRYCNGNFVESEYHFLLVCVHFTGSYGNVI